MHPLEKSLGVLTLHYYYTSLQGILRRLGTGRFILDALKYGSCKQGLISLMKAPVKVGWIDWGPTAYPACAEYRGYEDKWSTIPTLRSCDKSWGRRAEALLLVINIISRQPMHILDEWYSQCHWILRGKLRSAFRGRGYVSIWLELRAQRGVKGVALAWGLQLDCGDFDSQEHLGFAGN